MDRMKRLALGCCMSVLALLVGCASPTYRAPVEERNVPPRPTTAASTPASPPAAPPTAVPVEPAKPLSGAESAGKPGYYSVKPGDTLIRIGLESGQNWRDIARWSGLENPNLIEVGQVLRVVPPVADAGGVVARPVTPGGRVEVRTLEGKPATVLAAASAPVSAASGVAATPAPAVAPPGVAATPASAVAAPAAPRARSCGPATDPAASERGRAPAPSRRRATSATVHVSLSAVASPGATFTVYL